MDPVNISDVHLIQWKDFFYFAGGIAVIVLGGVGTILVLLGILQTKFLKPYRQKYPYKEFRNFKEFTDENPSGQNYDPAISKFFEAGIKKKLNEPIDDIPLVLKKNGKFKPELKTRKKSRTAKALRK